LKVLKTDLKRSNNFESTKDNAFKIRGSLEKKIWGALFLRCISLSKAYLSTHQSTRCVVQAATNKSGCCATLNKSFILHLRSEI